MDELYKKVYQIFNTKNPHNVVTINVDYQYLYQIDHSWGSISARTMFNMVQDCTNEQFTCRIYYTNEHIVKDYLYIAKEFKHSLFTKVW